MTTHQEQWAAIYAAALREQLGVRCLAQGHLSRGIEGEESTVHSLPPHKRECSRLAVNRGSRLDFTPRPTLFFLPAGFCCLVSSIEETPSARLSKLENYGFDQLVSQRD